VEEINLRGRALKAQEEHRAKAARDREENDGRQRRFTASFLSRAVKNVLGIDATPTVEDLPDSDYRAIAVIDGLTFATEPGDINWLIRLLWKCPACGTECARSLHNLPDLGDALADESWHKHVCPPIEADEVPPELDPNSLPARAKAAWEAQAARNRTEKDARDADLLKDEIKRRLGIECEPTTGTVEIEGVTFGRRYFGDGGTTLIVETKCPKCGRTAISCGIRSLEDVGAALAGAYLYQHTCPSQEPPDSSENRLLAALRDFVAENTPG
jgi:hypothetical protein